MKFLIKIGNKLKENLWEKKMGRVFVMFFLAGAVCLWDDSLYYSSRMPEIVFVRTKYDERGREHEEKVCEIIFIDKQGACYYSDDLDVAGSSHEKLINAYKAGKITDKIQFRTSCIKNGVMTRYRKLYKIVEKGSAGEVRTIPYGGLTIMQDVPRWCWEWLYFDKSGELQSVTFHSHYPDFEEGSNNKQVNQIYKWCKDVMGEMER